MMVSVVIPTYHRSDVIRRAIEGVRKQTHPDIEILIVDDNGAGTEHQIATERVVNSIDDKRIRYIVHPSNRGGCAARNTGITNSRGKYVAFLDDDDEWADCFIDELLPYFDDKQVGAVYCNFYSYNGIVTITKTKENEIVENMFQRLISGSCPASTSLFVVDKDFIEKAGMFDESLPSLQDYDMWLKLSKICKFAYCSKRLVLKYEGFGEQTSKNPAKREKGYELIINKYEKSLSAEEVDLFNKFKEMFYYDTLYRKIVYYHDHGLDYKDELKEYLSKYNRNSDRIRIWLKLHLPKTLYSMIGVLYIRFNGNYKVYWGKHSI